MKSFISGFLSVLLAAIIIAALPTEADAEIYTDTLRLHILAASDREEDQALKLAVRDAILAEFSAELSTSSGIGEAKEVTESLLAEIEERAEQVVAEAGFAYSVTAELSEEWYDTREYGEVTLPRGIYSSLIVRIGDGAGRNWWCVMYPPMCLDLATDAPSDDWAGGYTGEELSLITGKYRVKFKLLEMISDFAK